MTKTRKTGGRRTKRAPRQFKRGEQLRLGTGWRLLKNDRLFKATLHSILYIGGARLAVFRVRG